MTSRTQLSVELIAKVGGFEAGMKRAAGAASSASSRIKETVGAIGPAVGASLVAAAGAAALAVKSAIDQADDLSKLSQKIGISTEALSGLNVAAQLSDVSLQQLQGGITRLVRAQEDIASGTGNLAAVFDAIGVSATNADGSLRQTDAVLRDLADVFKSLPDGAEKTALAVGIFGRAGAELIPLLNAGSQGLREYDELAERLGVRLSTETGKAAEAFNDNLTILKIGLQGVATQVASELLPDLVNLTNQFTATDSKAKEVADSIRTVSTFFGGLADVAAIVKNTIEGVVLASIQLLNTLGAIGNLTNPLGGINALFGGESNIDAARRSLSRADDASILAGEAFGRAGRRISGEAEPQAPRPIEFITGENLPSTIKPKGSDDVLEALRKAREAAEAERKAAEGAAAARQKAAEATRAQAQADSAAQQAQKQVAQANADYVLQLEDYRAFLAGPLAEAELEWDRRQTQLEELAARGQVSQAQLAEGLDLIAQARQRDVEAIKAQLSPAQQVIADLERELELVGLSNTEKEIANALRYAGVDAMSAEGKQIAENIRLLEDARERIQFSDDIRRGFEDTFASIIDGSKSAKDAFADLGSYITSLIAQRLGNQLVESLFGPSNTPLGSNGGGGIGGLVSSFFGSLFGGPRAAGGFVSPGKMYEVAENGPEMLRVGNRQFLLPTATGGMVTPNARIGGGGVSQVINVQGRVDTRTANQLAQEAGRAQRRASARFGA